MPVGNGHGGTPPPRGRPPACLGPLARCEGAERRKAHQPVPPCGGCAHRMQVYAVCANNMLGGASPSGAPPAAFLSPGPCFRARMGGLPPSLIRAAFAALPPHRVQPLKAVPPSGDGRLPEASRRCACEAHLRAPHPTPPTRTPPEAPSLSRVLRNIVLIGIKSRARGAPTAACRRRCSAGRR